jgi:hypothetical protein
MSCYSRWFRLSSFVTLFVIVFLVENSTRGFAGGSPGEDGRAVTIVRTSSPTCEPKCPEWIAFMGEISGSSLGQVRAALQATEDSKAPIIISSSGGYIEVAFEIGNLIRTSGRSVAVGLPYYADCQINYLPCPAAKIKDVLKTVGQSMMVYVPIYRGKAWDGDGFCYSACPYILAAGTERLAAPRTKVGFHEATFCSKYAPGKMEQELYCSELKLSKDHTLRGDIKGYLIKMGISLAMMDEIPKASNEDIHVVDHSLLQKFKLVTSVKDVATLTAPEICAKKSLPKQCMNVN